MSATKNLSSILDIETLDQRYLVSVAGHHQFLKSGQAGSQTCICV
jgi:hypothetical protein